jgi:hypothetical protein
MKIVKYLRKNSDELIAVSKLQAEGQRFPSWRRQKASSWQEIDPVQSSPRFMHWLLHSMAISRPAFIPASDF